MKQKAAATTVALALVMGGLFWASPATATEGEEEVLIPTTEVVEEAPVEVIEEPVVEEVAPEPEVVVEEGPPEAVTPPLNEGVCTGEHMSPTADGDLTTETYTAPEGFLISGFCVKAGSINQGDGPEYTPVDPPAESITFYHSSGKDISHFSVALVEVPDEDVPVPALFNVTPTAPSCEDAGTFDTTLFPIDREGYVLSVDRAYDGPGEYTITATAKPGYVIEGSISVVVTVEGPLGYQSEDPEAVCYVDEEPEVVTLVSPIVIDECGTENDDLNLDALNDTEGVVYTWDSDDPENYDIRATVQAGFVVTEVPAGWVEKSEGVYVFAVSWTDEVCPTDTPTDTPTTPVVPASNTSTPAVLAATGGADVNMLVPVAGGLATLLGACLVAMGILRRRANAQV